MWAAVGIAWERSQLEEIRARPEEWYKRDDVEAEHFLEAATRLVQAKQRATDDNEGTRLIWAREVQPDCPQVGFAAAAPAVTCLSRPEEAAREAAVNLLLDLPPDQLSGYCAEVVGHCACHDEIRMCAITVLGHLDPQVVSEHAATCVTNLCGGLHAASDDVRKAACETLALIEPFALLASDAGRLRPATVELLVELSENELAMHAPAVVSNLLHANAKVRCAALEVIGSMDDGTLASLAPAVAAMISDGDEEVRRMAGDLLLGIDRRCLEELLPRVVELLGHGKKEVQTAAVYVLRKVDKGMLMSAAPEASKKTLKKYGLV